ncbi:MAG TPA: hypothetical protein VEV17_04700 [Bryobacteraceae bacterium]|nr:hypothetical protein [Bryobacteraceae bacterium]
MRGHPPAEQTHQIEELILAVEDLRRRVAALEQGAVTPAPAQTDELSLAAAVASPDVSSGLLAALGRLLLGIAGAYLLRAITEAGIVPPLTGALAGFAYAAAWLVATIRIPAANRLSVATHGMTAACIVAPLLWETTARFHTLSPARAAVALALFVILGQALAWRSDRSALAGVTAFAGGGTAIALIIATLDPVPFALALAACAVVVECGAWSDRALSWRWIMALAADFCALLLVYLVTRPQGVPEGYASVPVLAAGGLLVTLLAVYVASAAMRTLLRGIAITWFEISQIAAVAVLAIAGALRLSHGTGMAVMIAGAICLALGAGCYLAAFTGLARKPSRNFHAYATFALALSLAGSVLLLSGGRNAALWSLLAVAAAWLGARGRGNTLQMHGAIYLMAASAASGLWSGHVESALGWSAIACAIATALSYSALLSVPRVRAKDWIERVPAFLIAAVLCWSVLAIATGVMLRAGLEAMAANTLRTILIAFIAVALAWSGRHWRLSELIWLLFPWMIFGAAKLATEEFRLGHPGALSLSLLVYGGTLIALPRLLRRNRS